MESKDVAIIEPAHHAVVIKGNTMRPQPIIPHNIEEALEFAKLICDGGICPDSYNDKSGKPDPKKVVIAIFKGAEVGLPPITALANIAIINNRPSIYGDGATALVQDKNLIEKMEVEWIGGAERDGGPTEMAAGGQDHTPSIRDFTDDFGCIVRIWRRGQSEPYLGKFTVRDAKRAHLWGNTKKLPWIEHPKRMLFNRARAFPLRDGFADALAGLAIREEVEDMPPEAPIKTDTAFLDDRTDVSVDASQSQETAHTGAEIQAAPSEPGNAFTVPAFLAIPENDGQNDYKSWAEQAAEIVRMAPTPKWLAEWRELNATTIDGLKHVGKNGPAWHGRLLELIDTRRNELLAGSA